MYKSEYKRGYNCQATEAIVEPSVCLHSQFLVLLTLRHFDANDGRI